MKLCKDCKHYGEWTTNDSPDSQHKFAHCLRTSIISPVTGLPFTSEDVYCQIERASTREKACGPEAQYFEPRDA